MKELIGKTIKGFRFEFVTLGYYTDMDNFIGKIGIIIEVYKDRVLVDFGDGKWSYPLPEALNHIVEEHPQRGDEVLVWDNDESKAEQRIFLAYIDGAYYPIIGVASGYEEEFKDGETFSLARTKQYKPIPQKTKLNLQQIADKFGIDVNELEVER